MIPSWFELLLLGLAAFRVWKLLGDDVILDGFRGWLFKRAFRLGGPKAKDYVETLIECPWCSGLHLSFAWWGAWMLWPNGTTIAAVPFAISAIVGLLGHLISD